MICEWCGEKINKGQKYIQDINGNIFDTWECLEDYYHDRHLDEEEIYDTADLLINAEEEENGEIDIVEEIEKNDNNVPHCAYCGKVIKNGRNIYTDTRTGKIYCRMRCLAKANGIEWTEEKRTI